MPNPTIEVDYLIKGAGATGMAFADTLLTETDATIAMVDKHDKPGGHWNDAYPFVRLHQPSAYYGVNSRPLGTGAKDQVGLNKGFYELASGQEVLSHFDLTMNERFLPTGRVHYFPMTELSEDGAATGLLSKTKTTIKARKFVDGTHSRMQVPSVSKPRYEIDRRVTVVPLNELPRATADSKYSSYVVIGAGKTGMDACIWLLQNGADPDSIRWIMPRDFWLLSRKNFQPGNEFFAAGAENLANETEALAQAETIDGLFLDLESRGNVRRIDPSVKPEGYHCAIISDLELEQLRRIKGIVRMGRVTRIGADAIGLEKGTIPTGPEVLHVDCSAVGIPRLPSKQVFDGDRITLQFVRFCQPVFSAAFIGHVEATVEDIEVKNRICRPQAIPDTPEDYLRTMRVELANRQEWISHPELGAWMAASRLDVFQARIQRMPQEYPEALPHFQRYLTSVGRAAQNIGVLLGE
ncbi:MAG: NAD(P)/FAD-dependent oxidoreductase [Dehalococcoidia bacterium]